MDNKEKSEIKTFKLHGIQLEDISVLQLSIRAKKRPKQAKIPDGARIDFLNGFTPYDSETKKINVAVKLEMGHDDEDCPLEMTIEVIGHFCVDEENFPVEQIEDWANRNAPFLLHPFLREHAYALSLRCGFPPIILPLTHLPALALEKKPESKS